MLFAREREKGENQKHEEEKKRGKTSRQIFFDISHQFYYLGHIAICAHWV